MLDLRVHRFLVVFALAAISSALIIKFNEAEAEVIDSIPPKIVTPGDLYIQSQVPVPVKYVVKAIDESGKQVPVECDWPSGVVFKVGKTTVRCMASDPSGNQARKSFVVTVGYNIVHIPDWYKRTAKFWVADKISDKEFSNSLGYLMKEKIIHVPVTKTAKSDAEMKVPIWIKDNTKKWVDGKLSNDEFSIAIQWMIERGIIINKL